MKERPILFSAPMVRAILAGTKTQTRRVVKFNIAGNAALGGKSWHIDDPNAVLACPYGQPGDRLWVRESWGYRGSHWSSVTPETSEHTIQYRADDAKQQFVRPAGDEHGLPKQRECRPDEDYIEDYYNGYLNRFWKSWRPSIHMPRWASRITLEITDVRVERLQDISEAESRAEGIIQYEDEIGYGTGYPDTDPNLAGTGVGAFRKLWESINGAGAWDANPWVWVISFQQVQP